MDFFKERRFSIDPGKGKKMDGCPYSIYEDGRDVKEYIIPPKGYIFKGFRFDPDASNQIYDGMLIAEYEKEPFNDMLKSNLWKVLLAVGIVAVVAVVVFLALSVFKDPKPKPTNDPKTEVSLLAEATYRFGSAKKASQWYAKAAVGLDNGGLRGDNVGLQLTLGRTGLFGK